MNHFGAFLILLLGWIPVMAELPVDPCAADFWGSSYYQKVVVAGNTAYCGTHYGIDVLDITNPDQIRRTDHLEGYASHEMVTDGRWLVVNGGWSDTFFFDLADPFHPVAIGYAFLDAYDLYLHKDMAFFLDSNFSQSLRVFDLAAPGGVLEVNAFGNFSSLVMHQNMAILSDTQSSWVYDITDPTAPSLVTTWSFGFRPRSEMTGDLLLANTDQDVAIYDISDITQPNLLSTVDVLGGPMAVLNHLVFYRTFDALAAFDISDPSAPVVLPNAIGSYPGEGYTVSGGQLVTVSPRTGLTMYEMSDPSAPVVTANYNFTGYASGLGSAAEPLLYLGHGFGGLRILSAADPERLALAGTFTCPDQSAVGNVVLDEARQLLIFECFASTLIQDISNPFQPVLLGTIPSSCDYMDLSGDQLVCGYYNQTEIYDMSDPGKPFLLGTYPSGGAFDRSGDRIYLTAPGHSLIEVDISDPANPVEMRSWTADQFTYPQDVIVDGSYAYVLVEDHTGVMFTRVIRLWMGHPSFISFSGNIGSAEGISLHDGLLYLGHGYQGLSIYNVRDPQNPTLLTQMTLPGPVGKVYPGEDVLYATGFGEVYTIYPGYCYEPGDLEQTFPKWGASKTLLDLLHIMATPCASP